jgi:transcriptional regulator with XRE-family HTH domain
VTNIRNVQIMEAFGKRLREVRESKGLSQQELADYADISVTQVGRIERGYINTTISTIHVLADALDVAPYELLK